MRRLIVLAVVVAMSWLGFAASTGPVEAKVLGPNGLIAFTHNDPTLPEGKEMITTVNPDGTHPVPLHLGEDFRWSPDGSRLAIGGGDAEDAALIVNPDTGAVRHIRLPDPTLKLFCMAWSPDAKGLACGSFTDDASRNGIYTIRTSDGRGLTRITSNPTGLDFIGDWSPDGTQLVFQRTDSTRPGNANVAIFVVNLDGSGLRRISPWGSGGPNGELTDVRAGWSPDGSTILFGEGCSLFTVHPDGTGLTEIPLAGVNSSWCPFVPGWSPDGTKFVFAMGNNPVTDVARGTRLQNIYTANADGTDVQQVTHDTSWAFHDGSPDWGPHPLAT
jgi:dipeptidyl aminopeptidase/acylaminoacyl peptidase